MLPGFSQPGGKGCKVLWSRVAPDNGEEDGLKSLDDRLWIVGRIRLDARSERLRARRLIDR